MCREQTFSNKLHHCKVWKAKIWTETESCLLLLQQNLPSEIRSTNSDVGVCLQDTVPEGIAMFVRRMSKGKHLPAYKVNRTQKQLPQPSGTMRIFEVINGGWNKERHLQQDACSACLGIRSNMLSIYGPAFLSSLVALRHTQTTS
jgi:hypothetical protein